MFTCVAPKNFVLPKIVKEGRGGSTISDKNN